MQIVPLVIIFILSPTSSPYHCILFAIKFTFVKDYFLLHTFNHMLLKIVVRYLSLIRSFNYVKRKAKLFLLIILYISRNSAFAFG